MVNKTEITQFNDLNQGLLLLNKKADKLLTAVYLITDFLSDKEPMKWKLRELSLGFLSQITLIVHEHGAERKKVLLRIKDTTDDLTTLFSISSTCGLLSNMNQELLVREYRSLVKSLEDVIAGASMGANVEIPDSYFQLSEKEKEDSLNAVNNIKFLQNSEAVNYKGQEVNKAESKGQRAVLNNFTKKHNKFIKDTSNSFIIKKREKTSSQPARREAILQALKRKSDLTIKDISSVISGCSEKTIQRELISLIKDKIVKKEGERRWSKYSVIA